MYINFLLIDLWNHIFNKLEDVLEIHLKLSKHQLIEIQMFQPYVIMILSKDQRMEIIN